MGTMDKDGGRLFFQAETFESQRLERRRLSGRVIEEPPQSVPVHTECDVLVVGGGPAGTAAELAVGFGLAQQMMQQGFTGGAATPSVTPDLMGPADAARALGVSEADVMAVLESGELKGKKIGSSWRISRAALNAYLSE